MSSGCTLADQAHWAFLALEAYTEAAPGALFPVPRPEERVRLGVLAADAMACKVRHLPADRSVTDQASAEGVIGDLLVYVFCLTGQDIVPKVLLQAVEELRFTTPPVRLTAVTEAASTDVERAAAMLAALIEAAHAYGCDVPEMTARAVDYYEVLEAEDEEDLDDGRMSL